MIFWEPVFRAWLTALPYFIVGMLGAVIQIWRMRQQAESRDQKLHSRLDTQETLIRKVLRRLPGSDEGD